jgi:hypothetical protein
MKCDSFCLLHLCNLRVLSVSCSWAQMQNGVNIHPLKGKEIKNEWKKQNI